MIESVINQINNNVEDYIEVNFPNVKFFKNENLLCLYTQEFAYAIDLKEETLIYHESLIKCNVCHGDGGFYEGDPQGEHEAYACEYCQATGLNNFFTNGTFLLRR